MAEETNNGYRHIIPLQIRFNDVDKFGHVKIKGNNHIAGRTRITKIGNKSFHLEQDIIDTDTQEVKSHCTSIMVLYDLEHHQTIPLPDEWRQAITNYEGLDGLSRYH